MDERINHLLDGLSRVLDGRASAKPFCDSLLELAVRNPPGTALSTDLLNQCVAQMAVKVAPPVIGELCLSLHTELRAALLARKQQYYRESKAIYVPHAYRTQPNAPVPRFDEERQLRALRMLTTILEHVPVPNVLPKGCARPAAELVDTLLNRGASFSPQRRQAEISQHGAQIALAVGNLLRHPTQQAVHVLRPEASHAVPLFGDQRVLVDVTDPTGAGGAHSPPAYLHFGQELGAGSYAKVFKGVCCRTGAAVAIKTMSLSKMNSLVQQNLVLELLALRDINKEHVVKLLDAILDESSNELHVVLDYCSGGTLEEYMIGRRRASEAEARRMFGEMAQGLAAMHEKNYIHRDLKPANILLRPVYDVAHPSYPFALVIADLGFARVLSQDQFTHSYQVGTPLYQAPEIANQSKYDHKVDAYSVGCILYEMLVGRPYCDFASQSGFSLVKSTEKPRDYFQKELEGFSPDCVDLLYSLLRLRPEDRLSLKDCFVHKWVESSFMAHIRHANSDPALLAVLSPGHGVVPLPVTPGTAHGAGAELPDHTRIALLEEDLRKSNATVVELRARLAEHKGMASTLDSAFESTIDELTTQNETLAARAAELERIHLALQEQLTAALAAAASAQAQLDSAKAEAAANVAGHKLLLDAQLMKLRSDADLRELELETLVSKLETQLGQARAAADAANASASAAAGDVAAQLATATASLQAAGELAEASRAREAALQAELATVRDAARQTESSSAALQTELQRVRDQAAQQQTALEAELVNVRDAAQQSAASVAELTSSLQQAREQAATVAPLQAELASTRESLALAMSQLAAAEPLRTELATANVALTNARTELAEATNALSELEPLRTELAAAQAELHSARAQLQTSQQELEQLGEADKADRMRLQEALALMQQVRTEHSTLQRRFDDATNDFERQARKLGDQLKETEKNHEVRTAQLQEAHRMALANAEVDFAKRAKLLEAEGQKMVASVTTQLQQAKDNHAAVLARLADSEKAVATLKAESETARVEVARLQEQNQHTSSLLQEMVENNPDQSAEIAAISAQLTAERVRTAALTAQLATQTDQMTTLRADISKFQSEADELTKTRAQLSEVQRVLSERDDYIAVLQVALNELPEYKRK